MTVHSRLLLADIADPPAINPYRGATKQDVIDTARSFELACDLFSSLSRDLLQKLGENMRGNSLPLYDAANRVLCTVADLRGDIIDVLGNAEEECVS